MAKLKEYKEFVVLIIIVMGGYTMLADINLAIEDNEDAIMHLTIQSAKNQINTTYEMLKNDIYVSYETLDQTVQYCDIYLAEGGNSKRGEIYCPAVLQELESRD